MEAAQPGTSSTALIVASELPLIVNDEANQLTRNVGPGRILDKYYDKGGKYLESSFGTIAHKRGYGPLAKLNVIEEIFSNDPHEVERKLNELHSLPFNRKDRSWRWFLEYCCANMMEYTLSSESPAAQIDSFKSILHLVTYYPGLRSLLLRSKHIRRQGKVGLAKALANLWDRDDDRMDKEWNFFRSLAGYALLPNDIGKRIEECVPGRLGCIPKNQSSIIEILIRTSDDLTEPKEARMVSVRFMAGVLRLPRFWMEDTDRVITCKLLKTAYDLIQDVDFFFFPRPNHAIPPSSLDITGIDHLTVSILLGVKEQGRTELKSESLSNNWRISATKLLELLRSMEAKDVLPRTYSILDKEFDAFLPCTSDSEYQGVEIEALMETPRTRNPLRSFLGRVRTGVNSPRDNTAVSNTPQTPAADTSNMKRYPWLTRGEKYTTVEREAIVFTPT